MTDRSITWDKLPLFADDKAIGTALLGPTRAGEFHGQAQLLEGKNGFPPIDPRFGGRYVPALRAYFDSQYGLTDKAPKAPNGAEDLSKWKRPGLNAIPVKAARRSVG